MSEKRKALLTPLSVFGKPTEVVYQAGKEAERERIIALLASFGPYEYDPRYLIAAIKGEN